MHSPYKPLSAYCRDNAIVISDTIERIRKSPTQSAQLVEGAVALRVKWMAVYRACTKMAHREVLVHPANLRLNDLCAIPIRMCSRDLQGCTLLSVSLRASGLINGTYTATKVTIACSMVSDSFPYRGSVSYRTSAAAFSGSKTLTSESSLTVLETSEDHSLGRPYAICQHDHFAYRGGLLQQRGVMG